MSIEGVNTVTEDGRYRLPGELRKRYGGDQMAAYEEEPGKIVLERVEVGKEQ